MATAAIEQASLDIADTDRTIELQRTYLAGRQRHARPVGFRQVGLCQVGFRQVAGRRKLQQGACVALEGSGGL